MTTNNNKPIIIAYNDTIRSIVMNEIEKYGVFADLNNIDVSNVNDMEGLFAKTFFNGDISKWNVSNVKNMNYMFYKSPFNGDISNWDVSNLQYTKGMFCDSLFNGDISKWNLKKLHPCFITDMFKNSYFTDLSFIKKIDNKAFVVYHDKIINTVNDINDNIYRLKKITFNNIMQVSNTDHYLENYFYIPKTDDICNLRNYLAYYIKLRNYLGNNLIKKKLSSIFITDIWYNKLNETINKLKNINSYYNYKNYNFLKHCFLYIFDKKYYNLTKKVESEKIDVINEYICFINKLTKIGVIDVIINTNVYSLELLFENNDKLKLINSKIDDEIFYTLQKLAFNIHRSDYTYKLINNNENNKIENFIFTKCKLINNNKTLIYSNENETTLLQIDFHKPVVFTKHDYNVCDEYNANDFEEFNIFYNELKKTDIDTAIYVKV